MDKRRWGLSVDERLALNIQKDANGCWLWTGTITRGYNNGYATLGIGQKVVSVHRLMYEKYTGPIPTGMCIDHLCRVRHCVNPAHLEAVPMGVNVRRGVSPSAMNAGKPFCKNGHEFTSENTSVSPDRGGRTRRACKACDRIKHRAAYAALAAMPAGSKT